ncbi:MAG: O-antigen ligase family protein [Solirubrobacteraceae bacterium]
MTVVAIACNPVLIDRVASLRRPVVVVWLAAVALLAFRWLSPIDGLYERAIWSDLLIALAVILRIGEARSGKRLSVRGWHYWLLGYLFSVAVSAAFAADTTTALKSVVLVTELACFALLTADLAGETEVQRALAWTMLGSVVMTFVLAVIGLGLFYAGYRTGLLGVYGEQYERSDRYARVTAGFYSPPLLASWCIAASAVIAWPRGGLPTRWRVAGEVMVIALVITTFSRAVVALAAVYAIRWAGRDRSRVPIAIAVCTAAVLLLVALTVGRLHLDPTRPSSITYEIPDPGNRREAAATSWATFKAHPWFGSGPGSYPGLNRGFEFRAHLTPLNVAATVGLPALVALAGMWSWLWRHRSRGTDLAIWAGVAGLTIDGLAQDIEHFRHVWLIVGLAAVTTTGCWRDSRA